MDSSDDKFHEKLIVCTTIPQVFTLRQKPWDYIHWGDFVSIPAM